MPPRLASLKSLLETGCVAWGHTEVAGGAVRRRL